MAPTGEFCGIDPDEMNRMATSLLGGADRLTAFHLEFDRKLRVHGVDARALREIADIADWGKKQVPMLRGRAELIQALNAGGDQAPRPDAGDEGHGLIRLPDELEGFDAAQGLARMYGQDIFVHFGGELQATLVHDHIAEIDRLADNPQAAAAFFALLPPKVRDALPSLIASTGSKTARADLAAFSRALGAALRAPTLVPAFAAVRNDLVKPVGGNPVAWNRLALLVGADAPADVRSAAARALVLDGFVNRPWQDWRAAGAAETKAYGLPSDLVAMGLEVLAGDGTAVRHTFATMGAGDVRLDQVEKMRLFLDYAGRAGTGDEVADAFGRVLQAGTEAVTERPGRHSPAAAAFALDAIRAVGPFGDALPPGARESMVAIATSYIHELASGARFDKAAYRTSGLKVPENWVALPGVTPAFYLSPGDTYRFLRTFVGDERLTDDFDAVAARFRHDTLTAAARLDAHGRTRHFEDIGRIFGDLAGVEFKATLDVRGERDATDDLIRDITKNTLALGVDSLPITGRAVEAGWELTKAYVVSKLLDGWADRFQTRVEEATGARSNFILRQKYDMAQILHEAGYPASEPPAELINKNTGKLKTYDELVAEAMREADDNHMKWEEALRKKLTPYERWMDGNNRLDIKIENATRFQTSEDAKEALRIWR